MVSAIVGVFTVVRGQSFAGHALTDASATGGSGSLPRRDQPPARLRRRSVAGAGAMEAVGVRHVRGRDLATGIVLGASIGLASLFLYLDDQHLGHHRGHAADPVRLHLRHRSVHRSHHERVQRGGSRASSPSSTGRCSCLGQRRHRRGQGRSRPGRSAWPTCWRWPWPWDCRPSPSAPSSRPPCSSGRQPPPCALTRRMRSAMIVAEWLRRRRHLGRGAARLRQCRLGVGPRRLARQLLHRRSRRRHLPRSAARWAAAERRRRARRPIRRRC